MADRAMPRANQETFTMDSDRIKKLIDEAAERYNEGLYEEAIALWREVLAGDPSNQNAREGIRMASLLTSDWAGAQESAEEPGADEAQKDPEGVRARIEAGIARVKELVIAGKFGEALEGCELLAEIAPDLGEVRRLTQQVRRSAGAVTQAKGGDDIERELVTARAALADGRNHEAAEAAKRALEIDPANMEACGILSLAADDDMAAAPVSLGVAAEPHGPGEFDTDTFKLQDATDGGEVAPETTARVKALIAEGQAALVEGHPESAIEIWSRVFAIDRTNSQAGRLIDRAKASIEEQARRVDELFYRAVDADELGRPEEALELFQQVLTIAPNHQEARASLEEIKARMGGFGGDIPVDARAVKDVAKEKRRGSVSAEADAEAELLKEPASVPLAAIQHHGPYPPRVPAAPRADVAVKQAIIAPQRGGGMKRVMVAVAGALVVAAAGVGAWLWLGSGTGSMPEAQATVPVPLRTAVRPERTPTPADGRPAAPIEVVPGSAPKNDAAAAASAPNPERLKAQAAILTREGRQFFREQRWAEAVIALKKALSTDPLDFDAQDELDKAMIQLEKAAELEREMTAATKYFGEGDYASALHKFYRLEQDHPEIKILDTYILNSWFNWGVMLLQSGAIDEAVEKFDEVLQINAKDQQATRARDIGKRYHGRPRDSVFDAFANSLPVRTLDQR